MKRVRTLTVWVLALSLVAGVAVGLAPSNPPESNASEITAFGLPGGDVDDDVLEEAEIAALAASTGDNAAPLALAYIASDGKVKCGTPNVSCTYNTGMGRYQITIRDETYVANQYVTVATPSGTTATLVTDSADGKLVVYAYKNVDETTQSAFQFVTYKPEPLPDVPANYGKIITVTDATFAQAIVSATPVLIFCSATWCPYCAQMKPTIIELAAEYAGRLKVCEIDVDHSPVFNGRYGITAIPTVLTFKNGQLRHTLVGTRSKYELKTIIDSLL